MIVETERLYIEQIENMKNVSEDVDDQFDAFAVVRFYYFVFFEDVVKDVNEDGQNNEDYKISLIACFSDIVQNDLLFDAII